MQNDDYELREEYDLSQLPVMPRGRYDPERRKGKNVVILDPDIAQAFPDDDAVNDALRLVLQMVRIPHKAS
ncbi:MAG: ABC transporter permease [Chloroflexi bacterium]|nr:ABC transporter permease [Chloroflexota bacterium]MCI0646651.1 ABC transporter permease [Chloroflexota bacterium]